MPTLQTRGDAATVRITRTMNDHGAMTVEVHDTYATRHVVEYASAELHATLQQLPIGSSIPLELESVGSRANAWRAVRICGSSR
ncbi:hypothetical protein [Halogranum rubrum]|uniref:DUF7999 domain-containing protein n=1 Tax=Halogranum salarium B-1 TaxID=1210908 RepID=J2ZE62_9EURY|nr:hypothetical protein [Halogranum salarium]EJN58960.1 hypothetical protein HSB1_23810 [Halogranum salarium B-1]